MLLLNSKMIAWPRLQGCWVELISNSSRRTACRLCCSLLAFCVHSQQPPEQAGTYTRPSCGHLTPVY
jgi:hypothetical protein